MKGPKSSSWETSYLNQWLIVSNLLLTNSDHVVLFKSIQF